MGATVRITGIKESVRKIDGYADRAKEIRNAWPSVGRYLNMVSRKQFSTRGAYLGKPWKPLKPETKLWKLRHGYSTKPLVRTGGLREEFTGRPMKLEEYYANSARFGSNSDLAGWHQHGTRRNGKRVNPPRKMLVLTKKVREGIGSVVANHLMGREYRP